jgi:MotA/TolQ/ExbB proton channel family
MPTEMYCMECRYRLKGLAEHRCPECGREFDPGNPLTFSISAWAHRPINTVLGAVLLFSVLLWVGFDSGDITLFIDPNSMIFVVGIVTAGLWMCFGPLTATKAIVNALFGAKHYDLGRFTLGIAVLSRAYQLAWAAGLSGSLLGLIGMSANMGDPWAIGFGMASCLLTTIYGLILAEFIFSPLQQAMISRANVPMSAVPWHTVPQRSMMLLCIAVVLLVGAVFLVSLMAISP